MELLIGIAKISSEVFKKETQEDSNTEERAWMVEFTPIVMNDEELTQILNSSSDHACMMKVLEFVDSSKEEKK